MDTPAVEAKPDVNNGPQDKPQENAQGHGHNQFHGPGGGRGGRGGGMGGPNRRFGGPGRRDDNRGGNPNRGPDNSGPGNRPKPMNNLQSKVKEESDEHEGRPNMNRGPPGRGRGGGGFRGGLGRGMDDRGPRNLEDRLNDKLAALGGPTHDLPALDMAEKKFGGRNRLYIGNLGPDVTEEEIQQMFAPYGETSEHFLNKEKNFAFIKLDYHANAEKAKRDLDGTVRKGRPLKVRFAPYSTAMKVKNLTPWVTNELLEKAFSVFGDIERAVIIVDERGKSTGEGIVEFARKPGAQNALRRCTEGCYFLTASLRPVVLEAMELTDDVDGYPEKNIPKKNPDYFKSREMGPRFAAPGSFEYEYGTRWKQLFELRKQKEEALAREMKMEEEKLEAQMEYAKYEHETEMLREQLRQRELDRERQKRDWEMKERQAEEQRRKDEEMMRRQQEEMSMRMLHQDEELRRRQQENTLFMQEQALGSRNQYDSPSGADQSIRDYEGTAGSGNMPPDPKAFMDAYERGGRYESSRGDILDEMNNGTPRGAMGGSGGAMGGAMGANSRSRWAPQERGRVDDYQAKRRRF